MNHRIKYRSDIDGLRALSVIIVILFHFGVPGFSGGFVGVDIFFVISGYLISKIIIDELAANNFSFIKFYERRVRRIFPALFIVIIATIILGYFLFNALTFRDLGRTIISTSVFSSNIYFYFRLRDYFAPPNNPLLHTWSLAVEEQFYIFFPILLVLIYKFQKQYLKHYLTFLTILSFAFCVIKLNNDQPLSFYSPVTRAWEPLAGVLLSVNLYPVVKNKIYNEILAALGLILILIALFKLSSAVLYPGFNALLPILGASLIIYSGNQPATLVNKLLSFRPVVFIGQISYSLYLWHWLVLSALISISVGPKQPVQIIILIVVTLIVSYLSWRYIEQPFRNKQIFNKRNNLFIGAATANCLLLAIGFYIHKTNGMQGRPTQDKMLLEIEKREVSWNALHRFDNATTHLTPGGSLLKVGDTTTEPAYFLWGDSHSKALIMGFDSAAKIRGVSIYYATEDGMPPEIGVKRLNHKPDGVIVAANVIHFLAVHPNIKTVFLAARWSAYENNLGGAIFQDNATKKSGINNNKDVFINGFYRTITTLRAMNKNVVILTDVPEMKVSPSVFINERDIFYPGRSLNILTQTKDDYIKYNQNVQNMFDDFKKNNLIDILPIQNHFFVNNKCIIEEYGHLLYRDDNHLSYYGCIRLVGVLASALK